MGEERRDGREGEVREDVRIRIKVEFARDTARPLPSGVPLCRVRGICDDERPRRGEGDRGREEGEQGTNKEVTENRGEETRDWRQGTGKGTGAG